ncbi:MAG: hypothetical protein DCC57_20220 [Chloroflexi bacterium]|nr:MAG: hypothetical protein DCC57_20220 [Chloroflexota bacterium]
MHVDAQVTLTASDPQLVDGFRWAKRQALAYVFTGDPVGDWYEAALPGRAAFCMRDVAHQSGGAQVLGLRRHTHNMLRKFAAAIAASRDWCSYWEIDRHDRPCPIDYTDDSDFWYNLPANFDLLACAYREYLWTGDRRYLDDPVFRAFYARTVGEYIQTWDKDGDGIPEAYPAYGRRGIASYNEAIARPLMGGDLIAAQFGAFRAYAAILDATGDPARAAQMRTQAARLRALYESKWWDERTARFASFRRHDGTFASGYPGITNFFPLYMGLIGDPRKMRAALAAAAQSRTQLNVEDRSYLPLIFFRYGLHDLAYAELKTQMDPGYARRQYPEVSYAAIDSIAAGLMGLDPDATNRTVTTCAGLTAQTGWVELDHVPIFDNRIRVRHLQPRTTSFANLSGPPLRWRAAFAGPVEELLIDGARCVPMQGADAQGQTCAWVELTLGAQTEHTVTALNHGIHHDRFY